jgi:hypothetical protein
MGPQTSRQVEIAPSEVFAEFQALLTLNPNTRSQGRGEEAALEVLAAAVEADSELQAILLFEDNDIRSRSFVRILPERVTALSTGDLPHELEAAARIQSSDHILDRAAARGRNISRSSVSRPQALNLGWPCVSTYGGEVVIQNQGDE